MSCYLKRGRQLRSGPLHDVLGERYLVESLGGQGVDHPDPLQDTRNPDPRQIVLGEPAQEQPHQHDKQTAQQSFPDELPARGTCQLTARERDHERHADDEQEEREDQVGRSPAVPFRVPQRRIHK